MSPSCCRRCSSPRLRRRLSCCRWRSTAFRVPATTRPSPSRAAARAAAADRPRRRRDGSRDPSGHPLLPGRADGRRSHRHVGPRPRQEARRHLGPLVRGGGHGGRSGPTPPSRARRAAPNPFSSAVPTRCRSRSPACRHPSRPPAAPMIGRRWDTCPPTSSSRCPERQRRADQPAAGAGGFVAAALGSHRTRSATRNHQSRFRRNHFLRQRQGSANLRIRPAGCAAADHQSGGHRDSPTSPMKHRAPA